jgi:hypothetical protein
MSPVSCLWSLSNVLCTLSHVSVLVSRPLSPSHVSVPCLPSSVSVPSHTSLFLVSRPLSRVPRLCSLSPILVSCLTLSVPCLPSSFPSHTSLFFVQNPMGLSHVSGPCLMYYVPCLTYLFFVSRPLSHVSLDLSPASPPLSPVIRLCSLSKILWDCLTSLVLV